MERISDLISFLKAHDNYAVLGHVNPDGDAIGCAIATALALRAMGKRAFVYLPGGMLKKMAGFETTMTIAGTPEEIPFKPETAFAVDISAMDRFGTGLEIFESCPAKCCVDHHATNPGIGDVCVVDADAAACAEVIMALYNEMGMALSKEAATWLFIACVTDSGRFGFSSTRGETMDTAAACVRAGADVDEITSVMYRTRSIGHTRLLGEVLHAMRMEEDGRIAWSVLTDEIYAKCGALREDSNAIVNYLVEMEGVQMAFIAEERGDTIKFSLRSRGNVNVARDIALPFGGGGHSCAAGASVPGPMDEAIAKVLEISRKALKEL